MEPGALKNDSIISSCTRSCVYRPYNILVTTTLVGLTVRRYQVTIPSLSPFQTSPDQTLPSPKSEARPGRLLVIQGTSVYFVVRTNSELESAHADHVMLRLLLSCRVDSAQDASESLPLALHGQVSCNPTIGLSCNPTIGLTHGWCAFSV